METPTKKDLSSFLHTPSLFLGGQEWTTNRADKTTKRIMAKHIQRKDYKKTTPKLTVRSQFMPASQDFQFCCKLTLGSAFIKKKNCLLMLFSNFRWKDTLILKNTLHLIFALKTLIHFNEVNAPGELVE